MSMRKISLYIKDILENMEKAERFIMNMDFAALKDDDKTSYAIIRCMEIIGEATKNVPDNIRQKYPSIPWRDMAGMRDKLIHSYFGLNIEKILLVVKDDIPHIKPDLIKVLRDLESAGS